MDYRKRFGWVPVAEMPDALASYAQARGFGGIYRFPNGAASWGIDEANALAKAARSRSEALTVRK